MIVLILIGAAVAGALFYALGQPDPDASRWDAPCRDGADDYKDEVTE